MEGAGSVLGAMEYERSRGGRRVKSNGSADKMKLYAGIGAAGVAAGAAIAVMNDPMYDDEKRARGKEVKRNVEWEQRFMPVADVSPGGQLDVEMHDLYMKSGQTVKAKKLEMEARRKFHANSYEHQQNLVHALDNPLPEIKGSFKARMLMKARKAVSKL